MGFFFVFFFVFFILTKKNDIPPKRPNLAKTYSQPLQNTFHIQSLKRGLNGFWATSCGRSAMRGLRFEHPGLNDGECENGDARYEWTTEDCPPESAGRVRAETC
jgi:hypothetical protein